MREAATAQIPRINDPAPEIDAKSTHGPLKLTDYTSKGRYVMLFAHPSKIPEGSTDIGATYGLDELRSLAVGWQWSKGYAVPFVPAAPLGL